MQTAHRIITSMKWDWMQTGRKPSGICGAALYISALSHGLKCAKSDIIKIVHVCDATLTKRLVEFENTESGSLTIEEFLVKAKELDEIIKQPIMADKMDNADGSLSEQRILCEHKDSGKPYAHGLCQICYDNFMTISGGLDGGVNPPVFQLAEILEIEKKHLLKALTTVISHPRLDSSLFRFVKGCIVVKFAVILLIRYIVVHSWGWRGDQVNASSGSGNTWEEAMRY
ncbi:hypothetical protein ACLB2K_068669 [Fragaria x ananassa]